MSNLVEMAKAVKRVLMEVELKDAIGQLQNGDMMFIKLANTRLKLKIVNVQNGELIAQDLINHEQFTFKSDSYKDGVLTGYDKDGEQIVYPIKSLKIDSHNGRLNIDASGEEAPETPEAPEAPVAPETPDSPDEESPEDNGLNEDIATFNEKILNTKEGEVLNIEVAVPDESEVTNRNTGTEAKADSFTNIVFTVKNNFNKSIILNLSHAEGDKSGYYEKLLNKKNITLNKNKLLYEKEGQLSLRLGFAPDGFEMNHIINVKTSGNEPVDIKNNNDDNMLSKDALMTAIYNDPDFTAMWDKTPGLRGIIQNASPTGIYQVGQIMQKHKLNSAYLKMNSKVNFKILSKKIYGGSVLDNLNLDPKDESGYIGRILKEKTIITGGAIDKKHFELKLVDEIESNIYKVEVQYCINVSCSKRPNATIEITDINNDKK